MSQNTRPASSKARRSVKKDSNNLFKDGFNWDKYLQICNLSPAPRECFTQQQSDGKLVNNFQAEHKIEALDPRNPTSVCLSTVVALQGPRILIRLDGGDSCNDFWRLSDAGDIYPLGTHEAKGVLLQPPLGFTKNMSTWSSFLAKNREKGVKAPSECFQQEPAPPDVNLFEIGMKLEAVDRKNPDLICPATIGDINDNQVFISFDGWRGAMDYWCHFASRDLFPVGWCKENDHPLSSPGNRGDNPAVVERLKLLAENAKRKTRSVVGNTLAESDKNLLKARPLTPSQLGKPDLMAHGKGHRGRSRVRVPRPLSPVAKAMLVKSESATDVSTLRTTVLSNVSLRAESSAGSETCDSSVSSHESSDSSENEEELDESEVKEESHEEEKTEDSGNSDIDESVVEVKQPSSPKRDESSSAERNEKRHEVTKLKRKKRDKRKLSHMKGRRRHASAGDEEHYTVEVKKIKKKKRKHSMSSLSESPQKRILGFGNPVPIFSLSNQSGNVQSPSFLNQGGSPTSLFGFHRDEIVKKATEGWPLRLMGSSKGVVTSDNKLARFGSQDAEISGQRSDSEEKQEENAQVTTTTVETSNEVENRKTPDSTTTEGSTKISSHTVSSTTNLTPAELPWQHGIEKSVPLNEAQPKRRSRNPQRWSVHEVMAYVCEEDAALAPYAHLFQMHEIDGQALLLMNSSIAVKYMGMKLGPALKLSSLVEQLKELVPPPRDETR